MWRDGQQAVKPFRESLAEDQWLNVRYEDFVRQPVDSLKRLCAFLGEDYDDALMEFHTTPVAQRRGPRTTGRWPTRSAIATSAFTKISSASTSSASCPG